MFRETDTKNYLQGQLAVSDSRRGDRFVVIFAGNRRLLEAAPQPFACSQRSA